MMDIEWVDETTLESNRVLRKDEDVSRDYAPPPPTAHPVVLFLLYGAIMEKSANYSRQKLQRLWGVVVSSNLRVCILPA